MSRLICLAVALGSVQQSWSLTQISIYLSANITIPINSVSTSFLSYNLDTGSLYNEFNVSDTKLQNLLKPLAPAFLRIGGTAADYTYYVPNAIKPADSHKNVLLSNSMWDSILALSNATGLRILWDFNSLHFRDKITNVFSPSLNASALIAYTASVLSRKYPTLQLSWSAGNEPNMWPRLPLPINSSVLGLDALALRAAVNAVFPEAEADVYAASFADFGFSAREFFNATSGEISLTLHNYPLRHDCSVRAYLNSHGVIEGLGQQLAHISADARQMNVKSLLVLEEIGGSYGGGCENITDRFLSGFWYLHAMGVVAMSGFHRMHRQDIAGWSATNAPSHYQLLGPPGWHNDTAALEPHPDWWTSVLFRQLVGTDVYHILSTSPDHDARNVTFSLWQDAVGTGLVLIFTNPQNTSYEIAVNASSPSPLSLSPRVEYVLTSAADPASPLLQSDSIFLNGELLSIASDGTVPQPLQGRPAKGTLTLAPFSYGFVVLP